MSVRLFPLFFVLDYISSDLAILVVPKPVSMWLIGRLRFRSFNDLVKSGS